MEYTALLRQNVIDICLDDCLRSDHLGSGGFRDMSPFPIMKTWTVIYGNSPYQRDPRTFS